MLSSKRNRSCLQILQLVLLFLPFTVKAETIQLDFVLPFRNLVLFPHEFRTDLDCERTAGFNLGDPAYLKRDLAKLFTTYEISFVEKGARYGLRLYITHEDCGVSGEENYRSYPLGIGLSEKDFSSAYVRILAELQDRKTGQLVSMREYIALARLERNISRVLFLHLAAEIKQASKRDLWNSIAKELAKGVAEDVKR